MPGCIPGGIGGILPIGGIGGRPTGGIGGAPATEDRDNEVRSMCVPTTGTNAGWPHKPGRGGMRGVDGSADWNWDQYSMTFMICFRPEWCCLRPGTDECVRLISQYSQ
eukprot:scaffold770_cov107-Isochrysis_galbana.AAC.5